MSATTTGHTMSATNDPVPTRPWTIADKHRELLANSDFWIGVASDPGIPFDDDMRRRLRDDFVVLKEVLSASVPQEPPREAV